MKERIMKVILVFFIVISALAVFLSMRIDPITLKRKTFVYEYGTEISTNPADYVNGNEKIMSDVVLNMKNVKNEIGLYKASVTYAHVTLPFYIKIQDTTKPVVTLKQIVFNVGVGEKVYALDLLDEVEDNSEITAYFVDDDDQKKGAYVSFNEKGSYVENIIVEDAAGNRAAKLRVKLVVGRKGNSPTLTGINTVEIVKGQKFDPLDGVKASDGNGNDITSSIKILKNNVDVDEIGTYEVIYSVTNADGNTLQRTRKVVVIKSESEKKS